MIRTCSDCKTEKDISCFSKKGNGLSSRCKDCMKAYCHKWGRLHSEEHKAYGRAYYRDHKDEIKVYRQANCQKNQAYQKKYKTENREYLAEMDHLRRKKIKLKKEREAKIKIQEENNVVQLSLINP